MKRGSVLRVISGGVGLGLITTLLTSDTSLVSVRVWLATASGWFVVLFVARMAGVLPVVQSPLRPMIRRERPTAARRTRPGSLVASERAVTQSVGDPKRFVRVLQPRLAAVAGPPSDPHARFGDVAWLLDETVRDRAPTQQDLERFFDRLEGRHG